ncbi:MAG: hypothetical protein WC284_12960 [Candidimonas sp.]
MSDTIDMESWYSIREYVSDNMIRNGYIVPNCILFELAALNEFRFTLSGNDSGILICTDCGEKKHINQPLTSRDANIILNNYLFETMISIYGDSLKRLNQTNFSKPFYMCQIPKYIRSYNYSYSDDNINMTVMVYDDVYGRIYDRENNKSYDIHDVVNS